MILTLCLLAVVVFSFGLLVLALTYASGYRAGYERAQVDFSNEFIAASQELLDLESESHITAQRAAGRAGRQ